MGMILASNDENNIMGFLKVSLFFLVLVGLNPDLNSIRVVWWGIILFAIVNMLIVIVKKDLPVVNQFFIWMLAFFFWSTLSYFWSIYFAITFEILKSLLINLVVFWLLSCVIVTEVDIYSLFRIIVYATTLNGIYILYKIDVDLLRTTQIGADMLGESWNGNAIGVMMAFGVLISLLLMNKEEGRYKKIGYIFIIALSTLIVILTGSRKALFFVVFGYVTFTGLSSKSNRIMMMAKIIIIMALAYQLIMNIPIFYNILGVRLEGLFAIVTGVGSVDSSTELRIEYIDYGISWFMDKPIIGYGVDNYRVLLYRAIGKGTYSHNNYIELLVGVGLIGTIIYYYAFGYVLVNAIKLLKISKEPMIYLIMVIIVAILISQYGFVTYYDFFVNLIICISFIVVRTKLKDNIRWL
ncbi:MAG: hypothetical protein CVU95_05910 [Firmicutes bacterium HGW-Firmicutes-2]|jgi:O-antigen ligase|nr:MAG: hypothetical protein CVU95_05910 [Firmicutes bacterium HGW-Firmicutes-2]